MFCVPIKLMLSIIDTRILIVLHFRKRQKKTSNKHMSQPRFLGGSAFSQSVVFYVVLCRKKSLKISKE